jgi:hypothetical protein
MAQRVNANPLVDVRIDLDLGGRLDPHYWRASMSAFAAWRSTVSKPSVNRS